MLIKEWSWENTETKNRICFVSNSLYDEFLALINAGQLPSPLAAYRFPEKYRIYLDIISLYLFSNNALEIELEYIEKSEFYRSIIAALGENSIKEFGEPEEVPDIFENGSIYVELLVSGELFCNKVITSSIFGTHEYTEFRNDWWNANQSLSDDISKIKRLITQLKSTKNGHQDATTFFSSYFKEIDNLKLINSMPERLTFISAFLFSSSLYAFRNGEFNQALMLTHRSLEYSLTRVCWDIGLLTIDHRNEFSFKRSINIPGLKISGRSTNLFRCFTALENSREIVISAAQSAKVQTLNTCRNQSKLAHGLMTPNKSSCKIFIDTGRDISVALLDDSDYWKKMVKTFGSTPNFNIAELFSFESNFSDFAIKIV